MSSIKLSGTFAVIIADAVIHSKVRSRSGIVVAAIVIVGIAAIVSAAIVIPAAIVAGVAWRAAEDAAIVGIVAGIVIAVAAVVVFGKAVAEDGAAGICAGEVGSGITAAAAAAGSQTEHGRAGQSNEFQVLSFHGTNS